VNLNLSEKTYKLVKERIFSREFKPGQNITDSLIANELKISRTPVREALRRLEHDGLLVNSRGRGWTVFSLSLEDIHEIFELKFEVEGLIAKKAANCNDTKKQAILKDSLDRMEKASKEKDYAAWYEADAKFNQVIYSMCPNKRATDIANKINEQWFRVREGLVFLDGRMNRATNEHAAIVKSILDGNGDEAERRMQHHIHELHQELTKVLVYLVLPFANDGI
jgi:DNA-binding GntR family transcriptional regulator